MDEILKNVIYERLLENRRDPSHVNLAAEIVVFGSYAAGLNTPDSDIDVLCVGDGPRIKSRALDISWISKKDLTGKLWLGSELAGHIAKYGVWARGDGQWRSGVFCGLHAMERKKKRIISLARTATYFWDNLHAIFQNQYDVTIRRELQRLLLLMNNERIPPTKMLDDRWQEGIRNDVLELKISMNELKVHEGSKGPSILSMRD